MNVHIWEVPIRATWHKSNTLVELNYDIDGVEVIIAEEETLQRWHIEFDDVAGLKVITGEHMKWSTEQIPPDGGFFEITDSPWLSALGLVETNDQETPHHFVICCRREIVEVAAFEVALTPA